MSTQQQEVITIDTAKEEADREEGEIVDEFEYILSSEDEDEETITKRIKELEARNDELEKIATISGAGNTYPTDVFEISDYEDDYYSRNYSSRGQGKMLNTQNQNHKLHYNSEANFKVTRRSVKKRRPRRKKKQPPLKPRVIVQKPDESASSDSDSQEEHHKVSQDVLRFAVETQNMIAPNKRNLRERLILDTVSKIKKEEDNTIVDGEGEAEAEEETNDVIGGLEEDSIDIEEQELRMMALKSAIMNRHSDRVKRKKESTAYSPSDFDAVFNQSPVVPEEVEGTETPNMDISPIASPASILSEEDVQPVDMDIENSEEEEFPIAQFQEEMICSEDNIPKPLPVYQAPDNEEEEEEEALRALLLSKLSSPKVMKLKLPAQNDENQENTVDEDPAENTPAMILKKAVQRLKEKKLSCDIIETQILPVLEEKPKTSVTESEEKVLREKPQENQQRPQKTQKKIVRPVKKKTEPVVVPVIAVKKPKTNLITTVPNRKVRKLVINLQNSEDEEHELCGDIFTKHFLSTNISLDSENFADAASPSSLLFVENNSTSNPSTPRSNSPFVTGTELPLPPLKKQITNDVFEAKLDTFLKNARSQVEQSAKKEETKKTVQGTPMAVRHLPESSRAEYRKLIKRMELLEKQKQLGLLKLQQTQQKNKVDTIKITIKNSAPQEPKRIVIQTSNKPAATTVTSKPETKKVIPHVTPKPAVNPAASEIKVTDKVATATRAPITAKPPDPKLTAKPAQTPVNKEELFHKVETQYNKNESLLLENLSKNLVLVETAMISKTRKLELEARLSVLVKEMKTIESDLKEENSKINKIYPQIRFLHKTMEDLKSKRTRLYKYANTLGKTAKNGQISLKDSQRGQISAKYKNLATRMRTLKALNKDNVTLTKDCSTQVELEENSEEDQESTERVEDDEAIPISPPPQKKDIEEVAQEEGADEDDSIVPLGSEKHQTLTDENIRIWSNEYISPLNSTSRRTNTRCVAF